MQLRDRHSLSVLVGIAIAWVGSDAKAQVVDFDTTHTVYYEAPSRTNMFVYTPGVNLAARPYDWLEVHGGWQADVVSGASVKNKTGAAYKAAQPAVDVVTTASVHDLRNLGQGGFTLKKENVSFDAGYVYSTEHDYVSHSVDASARTELFEHDTLLQLDWSHNWDRACDRIQSLNTVAVGAQPLEDSVGCFTTGSKTRTAHDISIDSFQGGWSQAWTPTFQTQFLYTAQILNGFQSDPYRSVQLGQNTAAQEHVPDNRTRHAVTARFNLYLSGIKAALRLMGRGYWDTWAVQSGTGEAEFEKYFGEHVRVGLHLRYYNQIGAVFWSDDYTGGEPPRGPRGAYFTGDRELSPLASYMGGLRFNYGVTPANGRIAGIMTQARVGLYFDVLQFDYREYTLGGAPVTNARSYIGGLVVAASF